MVVNLVPNGNFEAGVEGWADLASGVTVNTLALTSLWSAEGDNALEYKATNSSGSAKTAGVTQPTGSAAPMAVVGGTNYTARAKVNVLDFGTGTGPDVAIVWFTAAGAQISVSESGEVAALGEQTLSLTAVAPPTAALASVRVRLVNVANGKVGWFYLDSVKFFNQDEVTGLEKVVLNDLDLNDGDAFVLESLDFKPAEARPQFAGNADADGEELVEEPHYTNAFFELQVRVAHREDTDAALAAVGRLIDHLQSCARIEGGAPLEWTPNESTQTYTWHAILGEIAEVPIAVNGELAGWFLESPVLKIKLTCRPFGYTDERVVLTATESSAALQVAFVAGVEGDVPAEGRLVLTDKASQKRRYAEWGADVVEDKTVPALERKATTFSTSGYAGSKTTLAGSISSEVVKAAVIALPMVLASTGNLTHVGSYRAKLRCYGPAGALLRASYQVGDGPLTHLSWQEIPQTAKWYELDLGEVFFEAAERGEQVSKILIESEYEGPTTIFGFETNLVYLDVLDLIPTRRYAVARGPADTSNPSVYTGFDSFVQSSGTLSGKTAPIGGTWAGAGDADDFSVNEAAGLLQRTAVSDAANTPRYAILGSTKYTNVTVGVSVTNSNPEGAFNNTPGHMYVMARYIDTNNWVRLGLYPYFQQLGSWAYSAILEKRVAGTITVLNSFITVLFSATYAYAPYGTPIPSTPLKLMVLETGEWTAWINGSVQATGTDSDLATGGALAEGKVGLQDYKQGSVAATRSYNDFTVFKPELGTVCNSGQSFEARATDAQAENTTGTYWSPVPIYRGSGFYLEPAGAAGVLNRLAVKMRRNDIAVESDPNTADAQTLEVLASERFLTPR